MQVAQTAFLVINIYKSRTISNLLIKLPKLFSSSELFFVAKSAQEKAESCPSGRT